MRTFSPGLDNLGLGRVLTDFGASWLALGGGLLGASFGLGSGFLSLGAHDLLQAQRKGAACFGIDKHQAKESNAGHHGLIDTGEKAVETKGLLPGFGDDDLIASKNVDIIRVKEVLAKEAPEELCSKKRGGKEALNGAVAGAVASPASDAGHRDAAGHGQEGEGDVAQLADGSRRETRGETLEQC